MNGPLTLIKRFHLCDGNIVYNWSCYLWLTCWNLSSCPAFITPCFLLPPSGSASSSYPIPVTQWSFAINRLCCSIICTRLLSCPVNSDPHPSLPPSSLANSPHSFLSHSWVLPSIDGAVAFYTSILSSQFWPPPLPPTIWLGQFPSLLPITQSSPTINRRCCGIYTSILSSQFWPPSPPSHSPAWPVPLTPSYISHSWVLPSIDGAVAL